MNMNKSPIEVTVTIHFVLTTDPTEQYPLAAFAEQPLSGDVSQCSMGMYLVLVSTASGSSTEACQWTPVLPE